MPDLRWGDINYERDETIEDEQRKKNTCTSTACCMSCNVGEVSG